MPLWTVSPVFQSGTALVAQLPDSAATGGGSRGANAVDWQTVRASASEVASGNSSAVLGGANNRATATNTTVAGGSSNIVSGVNGWCPGGSRANTRSIQGMGAWGAGFIAASGDAQSEEHVLRRQTTDATATRLTSDNAVAGTGNTINLGNFSAIAGRLVVRGRAEGASLSAAWFIDLSATRDASAASTLIEGGGGTAIAPTHSRGLGSAWRLDVTADTTNGGIAVTVTGAAATTINWTARFSAVQVATAS